MTSTQRAIALSVYFANNYWTLFCLFGNIDNK